MSSERNQAPDNHGNSHVSSDMKAYYARRASEYERIYGKPERQKDLERLRNMVPGAFAGHEVLEIACGTGYWTQYIARTARRIVATDYNPEVLDVARQKDYAGCQVIFQQSDAYQPAVTPDHEQPFSAGFHGFWWSHVRRENLHAFIEAFHARLETGAVVVMMDNKYVDGSSTPVSREDENGNTFQMRSLDNGTKYEVLKNFQDETELREALGDRVEEIEYMSLEYYWFLKYKVGR